MSRTLTAEDLYLFQLISDLRISPEGAHILYTQQRVDRKTEKKYSNLWAAPTDGAAPRQFTYGDQNDSRPRWSPDGHQVAFLSNRGDKEAPAQIYIIPFNGGEARPLTDIKGRIDDFYWSPDGSRLVCSVVLQDPEEIERAEDEEKKKLGVVSRHYERVFYKLDGSGYLPHERKHLWIVDASSGAATQLTDHPVFDENFPAFSPDGQWIAFTSNRSADPDMNPDATGLYVIPVSGGEMREVPTPYGPKSMPSFSPDGRWIAYYGAEGKGQWYKNNCLWVVPFDGSAAARNLTAAFDFHINSATINDMGQPELMPPTWRADGSRIYFQIVRHGSSLLQSIAVDGSDLRAEIEIEGVVGSFTFDREGKMLAYFCGGMKDPGQVCVKDLATAETRQLTQVNRELLEEIELGEVETVWINGPDGNDLQGWIIKPPGFDPTQKYPSILEIHGGPMTQYGYFFMHEFFYLAAQGFVVHFCNPRGGRGYGESHTKAIWGDWGGVDYADIMAWTDHVAQLPYIDVQRMGVTGGSYGGYMTVWIIGHTQRFKAAVTQRCVSNFTSMWGSSDMNWVFQHPVQAGAPFEDLDKYWDMSPIKYIGAAKTPTLVIHSENDLRCPIEQGEQVFVALKRLGVESEMVRFPDEFHGLSRNGRTDRRIVRLNHILRWFERFLV